MRLYGKVLSTVRSSINCQLVVSLEIVITEEGGGFRMGNTCIPVADSF